MGSPEMIPHRENDIDLLPIPRLELGLRTAIEHTQATRRERIREIYKAINLSESLFSFNALKKINDTLIAINELLMVLDEQKGVSNEEVEQLQAQLSEYADTMPDTYNIKKAVQLALHFQ